MSTTVYSFDLPDEHLFYAMRDAIGQHWFSLEEAAVYLDIPLGTLKSRLHRGRQHLTEVVRDRIGLGRGAGDMAPETTSGRMPC